MVLVAMLLPFSVIYDYALEKSHRNLAAKHKYARRQKSRSRLVPDSVVLGTLNSVCIYGDRGLRHG